MNQGLLQLEPFWKDAANRRGPPATQQQINETELRLHCHLPEDLSLLYQYANGFTLFNGAFRLLELASAHTFASTVANGPEGERDAISGWTAPAVWEDSGWAFSPGRIRAFDLTNGDYLSWLVLPNGAVRWIDDWNEVPSIATVQSVDRILELALAPGAVTNKQWHSPFKGKPHSPPKTYDDFPRSPPHFRARVALDHSDFEHALKLARNGQKGDRDFRSACDAYVIEALSKLGRVDELKRELARLQSRGEACSFHPEVWLRIEEGCSALPQLADELHWIRKQREKAEAEGDFF